MDSEQSILAYRPGKPRGFRMSVSDALVLLMAAAATGLSLPWLGQIAWLFIIVAGYFFLFCNVFRIQRVYELVWAGLFVVNVSVWYVMDALDWWWVLAVQSPITVLFITMSFLQRDYHGVFWRFAPSPRIVEAMDE